MNERMSARRVVVIGAASGIGRAVALSLAAEGASLALLDRDAEALSRTAEDARAQGAASATAIPLDVADGAAVAEALALVATPAPIDGLVCAAGVLVPGRLAETTSEQWRSHLDVNATGVFHLLHHGAPHLRDGASVVVVSSNAARVPRTGMLAYAASKAAASAVTRCAGLELAARGIRCNVVEPGTTDTPMLGALWSDAPADAARTIAGDPEQFRVGIPLGRIGDPGDVAAVIRFLLSDDARHVALQQIYVDGGASL